MNSVPEALRWVVLNSSDYRTFERLLITEGVKYSLAKMAPSLSASPNPVPAGEGPGQRPFHGKVLTEKSTFR